MCIISLNVKIIYLEKNKVSDRGDIMQHTKRHINVTNMYTDIKAQIISGELKHDDRLIEVTIAKTYDASRLHAKEAFRLLEDERLVKHIPNRGFIVRGITSEMINEIVEIRQALEKVIFKEFIQTFSDEDMENLTRLAKRFEVFVQNDMYDDARHELNALYSNIYSLSKYKRIIKILTQYSDYIDLVRNMTLMTKDDLQNGVQNLNDLINALRERNIEEMEHQLEIRHTHLTF